MLPDRYLALLGEYDSLVEYAQSISCKLVGTELVEPHLSYADAIFTKLLCHAISLRKLSPVSQDAKLPELWDLASASAVARSLIEAFDALSYIALQPTTSDERSFRLLLWELHDQQRRLRMLERIGSSDPRVAEIRTRSKELVGRLQASPPFAAANGDFRARVLRGDAPPVHLSQKDLNAASNVDHDYYIAATMFLSQYVHTLPVSVHQLMHFRAGDPEALRLCSMPLQYSMAFLARATEGMLSLFPHGYVAPSATVKTSMETWLHLLSRGVRSAG